MAEISILNSINDLTIPENVSSRCYCIIFVATSDKVADLPNNFNNQRRFIVEMIKAGSDYDILQRVTPRHTVAGQMCNTYQRYISNGVFGGWYEL